MDALTIPTLPPAFKEGYSSTFAIIDASEIFLETPSDLHVQSSTWSSYKHHNTANLLVCCTPNGVISFVSPLYVGGISDVELTRVSGLSLLTNQELVSLSKTNSNLLILNLIFRHSWKDANSCQQRK